MSDKDMHNYYLVGQNIECLSTNDNLGIKEK